MLLPELFTVEILTAALDKLGINIPIDDLVKTMQEEVNPKRVKCFTEEMERFRQPEVVRELLNLNTNDLTPVVKFVPNPTEPPDPDPRAKEHRLLIESLKKLHLRKDVAANKLPAL